MPEEGADLTPQDALLSTSEILRLVGLHTHACCMAVIVPTWAADRSAC